MSTTEHATNTLGEATRVHTRALKVSLVVDESRAFWESWSPHVDPLQMQVEAFEGRWFGQKSMVRVKTLVRACNERFTAFPQALALLHRWLPIEPDTCAAICHWHIQLADPLYRAFSGPFLRARRAHPNPTVDRDIVARWIQQTYEERWGPTTTLRMATGLLSTAQQAGLCTEGPGTRTLRFPRIPDEALTYLLYLLRELRIEGSALDNPYLASVGLEPGFVEPRLRRLAALDYRHLQDVVDMGWRHPNLMAWAEACLELREEDA